MALSSDSADTKAEPAIDAMTSPHSIRPTSARDVALHAEDMELHNAALQQLWLWASDESGEMTYFTDQTLKQTFHLFNQME
jgi:hypothetical protein